MKKITILIFLLILIQSCSSSNEPESKNSDKKIKIGALIPITSRVDIDGYSMNEAIKFAENDISNETGIEVEIIIKDSELHFQIMAEALREFKEEGVSIIVAASTSFNLSLVENLIAELDLIVIDVTSTSTGLSKTDNLFRFVPDDDNSVKVINRALADRLINDVGIIYRSDIWGENLYNELSAEMQTEGKSVVSNSPYSPRIPEDEIPDVVENLNLNISNALVNSSTDNVAVVLFSFDEGNLILKEATKYANLSKVTWFGSDGLVNNPGVIANDTIAAFAEKVGLFCPVISEGISDEYKSLKDKITAKVGYSPYIYSIVAYDAVKAAALVLETADENSSTSSLKELLVKLTTEKNDHLSGPIELNENGDRINCSYEFWGVKKSGAAYIWYNAFKIE